MEVWTTNAEPEQVACARAFVSGYARRLGVDDDTLAANMLLAVSEAVTNAVMHAFPDRPVPTGRIRLEAEHREGAIEISVADDGIGLRERTDSPGAGFGRTLIAAVTTEVTTTTGATGTTVTMRFALPA